MSNGGCFARGFGLVSPWWISFKNKTKVDRQSRGLDGSAGCLGGEVSRRAGDVTRCFEFEAAADADG